MVAFQSTEWRGGKMKKEENKKKEKDVS